MAIDESIKTWVCLLDSQFVLKKGLETQSKKTRTSQIDASLKSQTANGPCQRPVQGSKKKSFLKMQKDAIVEIFQILTVLNNTRSDRHKSGQLLIPNWKQQKTFSRKMFFFGSFFLRKNLIVPKMEFRLAKGFFQSGTLMKVEGLHFEQTKLSMRSPSGLGKYFSLQKKPKSEKKVMKFAEKTCASSLSRKTLCSG